MSDSKTPPQNPTPPVLTPHQQLVQRLQFNPMRLVDVEKAAIEAALRSTGMNVTRAATLLDIGRTTLYRKMKLYGLE